MTDRVSAEGLRDAVEELLRSFYDNSDGSIGVNADMDGIFNFPDDVRAVRAALRSSERDSGLDVDRLTTVLTDLDPDTGQDDWQLIHVSQGDDYAKSRREWAHAIARRYAHLSTPETNDD